MTWRIIHKPVTESTNKDALSGVPGDVFAADMQMAGRGRLDHKWLSPPGENLLMSAVIDVAEDPLHEVVTLPLIAGLAVAKAICKMYFSNGDESGCAKVKIKWPNDILVEHRKICGILCERNGDNIIIGIGINVNQSSFASEIADRATSLRLEMGKSHDVEKVRNLVLTSLSDCLSRWKECGFARLLPELSGFDTLKGRKVAVFRTDEDKIPVEGLCGGIRPDGMLDVEGEAIPAGEAHIVTR